MCGYNCRSYWRSASWNGKLSSTGRLCDHRGCRYWADPYYVTSLDFTLTQGTLRHALTQSNKCVVFEVGGRMVMPQSGVVVTGSNLTICGETAPAPGIIIQGGDFKIGAVQNVHFRHITWERGHDDRVTCNSNGDGLFLVSTNTTTACENIWFDHCAVLWGNDELVSLWPTSGPTGNLTKGIVRNISFTSCIFGEPLANPQTVANPAGGFYRGHYQGTNPDGSCKAEFDHGYGMIIGLATGNVDIQYSMWTDSSWRNPFIDGDTSTVLANNISLNCKLKVHVTMNTYDTTVKPFKTTVVGYLDISGPDSTTDPIFKIHSTQVKTPPTGSVAWVQGLYAWQGPNASKIASTTPGVYHEEQRASIVDTTKVARPIDIPSAPVTLLTADQIYQRAKDNIGPRPKDRANGPVSIQKIITKLSGRTGKFVNHPSEVGGMSTLATKTRSLRSQTVANPEVL